LGFFLFTGGGVNQPQLEKLKKLFYAYSSGASNASRFPAMALRGEKADGKWVGVRNNSRDAEYHQFMTLLFSIFCMLSGTDPRELSLGAYGDAVGQKSIFDEPTDGIVKESKDTGLKTFLQHFADSFNSPNKHGNNVCQEITKLDVKLQFTGFQIEDKKQKLEISKGKLATIQSVNDLLAEQDKERQELMLGDVNIFDVKGIQNPQIFQAVLFNAQQKSQQPQPGQQPQLGDEETGKPGEVAKPNQAKLGEPDKEIAQEQNDQAQEQPQPGQDTDRDKQLIEKYKDVSEQDSDI